jgi:hypothetical protein
MSTHTITVGNTTLTRVGYVDAAIPAAVAGLTPNGIAQIPWRSPLWTDCEQLRVGAAAWFADVAGTRLAFDPLQAADYRLRADRATEAAQQSAIARVFAESGFARESVDLLVMTHIEGVGMVAWRNEDGSWAPFFPNARVLVSDVVLREFLAQGEAPQGDLEHEAWTALIGQRVVDTFSDGETLAPGLMAEVRGGHCPGHAVLHFNGGSERPVTMLGHLAISPILLATGECAALNADPPAAWSLLHEIADDGRLLIGPLWPSPGFGRWTGGAFIGGQ